MTEQTHYQKLLELTEGQNSKIDPYTMFAFASLAEQGGDVDGWAAPMLAQVRDGGLDKIKEHAKIYSVVGDIVALSARPEQLIWLLSMPEVISLEASK